MQILSARHVKTEESLRLGVVSGWYSTKVSGTFVTGPHTTREDCLSKISRAQSAAGKEEVLTASRPWSLFPFDRKRNGALDF